jgi:CRP-like cAMP-binding protein
MDKYFAVLKKCVLFRNIREEDLGHLLNCLGARVRIFNEDEYVFLAGSVVNYIGIVLSGRVDILKESPAGSRHILAYALPSNIFAEVIVCTQKRISPVTVQAKEPTEILLLPYERIIIACGNSCEFHFGLIQNMMLILGEKNLNLNRKLEILTLKGMRERIASYLISEYMERGKTTFLITLNRTELADYLNVSRTSMCRELARMKEDGLIDFYGNSFRVLDRQKLAECLEV